jgi:hypothetical protein
VPGVRRAWAYRGPIELVGGILIGAAVVCAIFVAVIYPRDP